MFSFGYAIPEPAACAEALRSIVMAANIYRFYNTHQVQRCIQVCTFETRKRSDNSHLHDA